jgi:N-acetylmuramoyl-L-alanine amidase
MLRRKIIAIILIFFYCSAPAELQQKILQRFEIKQRHNQTTIILTLKNNTNPSFFLLPNPNRLVVDLPEVTPSSLLPKEIHSNGLITKIRFGNGPTGLGGLRLVFDLTAPAEYTYLNDQDEKKSTQTITIFLTQKDQVLPVLPSEPVDLIQPFAKKYASLDESPMKKIIVMIDPGHGGKDCGALGPSHAMEKMIVLAISKKLKKILNNSPGIDARMTRNADYFISLRQRLNIARHQNAQLFVAIHADSYNETAEGASVFALSAHGATSEAARWLAQRENTSELCGIDLKVKDRELRSVLLDMSQTATIQDSLELGNTLLATLKPLTPLHSAKVEQAGFMVLKSPDIPSVLVETGFVSNPKEELLLQSADYQNKIAEAIAAGIEKYLSNNPPPGSLYEMRYKQPQG